MPSHTNTNPTTPTTMPNPTTPLRPQPNSTTPTRPNHTPPTRPNSTTPLRPQPHYPTPTMPNYTTPPTPTRPPACLPTGIPVPPPPYTPSPIFPYPNPPPPDNHLPHIPYLPPPALNAALDTVAASAYLLHPRLSQFNTSVLLPRLISHAAASTHGIDVEQPLPAAVVDLPAFQNVVWRMQREVEEAIEAVAVRALGRVVVVVKGWRGEVEAAGSPAGRKQTGEWWLGSAAKYCFGVKE